MAVISANFSQNIDDVFNPFFLALYSTSGTAAAGNSDGITWAATTALPTSTVWQSAAYGLGMIAVIASTSGTNAAVSSDKGVTWSARTLPTTGSWYTICFGGGKFVAACNGSTAAAVSTDGITWSSSTIDSSNAWKSSAYGNNTWVLLSCATGYIKTAVYNGSSWTTYTHGTVTTAGTWSSITYGNGKFIAVASGSTNAAYSTDGINWTMSNALPQSTTWTSVCWAGAGFNIINLYCAVSSAGGYAATSPDGITWTQRALPNSNAYTSVCYGGSDGMLVAVNTTNGSGGAASSIDGITWTSRTTAAANSQFCMFAPYEPFSGDTLTINNGSVITCNTNQQKYWSGITIANGRLNITNDSTSTPIRFGTGKTSGSAAIPAITPSSGLGSVTITGSWIELGTSNGTANQTFTSPYSTNDFIPTVWVETSPSTGIYEPWVNVTGQRDFDVWTYARNGINGVGNGDGGTCFTQAGDRTKSQYLKLANCTSSTGQRLISCTSTTGLKPGAWITGRGLISTFPSVAVVEKILSSTTFTVNVSVNAGYSGIQMIAINPTCSQYGTTLTFGDNTHGKIPPNGCKIKVPNIMVTDYTSSYWMGAWSATNHGCKFVGTNAGVFNFNTCLFGESYSDFTQSQSLTITNVGYCFAPYVTECYSLSMNSVGISLPPVTQYPGAATALGATGSTNSTTTVTTPATNAIIPGVLIWGDKASVHACTVSSVTNNTTIVVDVAAYATIGTLAISYMGVWTPRDLRMLFNTTAGLFSSLNTLQYTYVSNATFTQVVIAYGGWSQTAAGGAAAIITNGIFNIGYSNDVTITNCKGIKTGSYPRGRGTLEAAINLIGEANNVNILNGKFFNINLISTGNGSISNITIDSCQNKHGIFSEGYGYAAGVRAYKNPTDATDLAVDTKYWLKTRAYRTHDFQESSGYVDSQVVCGAFDNPAQEYHYPRLFAAVPYVGTSPAFVQPVSPSLAYGNSVWVAVFPSTYCALVSSDNGANWQSVMLPGNTTWWKVYWFNNQFVVVGGGSGASAVWARSSNGYDWVLLGTAVASATWQAAAYDASIPIWVGIAGGGTAGTVAVSSTDGFAANRTARTLPSSSTWIDVATSGAGRFVAIAGGAAATASAYSTNGTSWSAGGALASSTWQSIAYGNSKFVAISSAATNGPISSSTDGVSWSAGTLTNACPTGQNWVKIIWTGTVFVAMTGVVPLSATAVTAATPTLAQLGQCITTSSDGTTWSAIKYLPDYTTWVTCACNGNAVMFISTITGKCAYTSDITASTPTFTLYDNFQATWNRVGWTQQNPNYIPTADTIASMAVTSGSTTATCTSTVGLQVGDILSSATLNTCVPAGSLLLGNTPGVTVVSITNDTTFEMNIAANRTNASVGTVTIYKHVYQIFRSTSAGFTTRDYTTLIGSTNAAATVSFEDCLKVNKDTSYYYILRKLSAWGTVANCSGVSGTSTITTSGTFYSYLSTNGFRGITGSNILFSTARNFFELGTAGSGTGCVMPGALVSGTGIPNGTSVVSVDDYNQITLSANLTQDVLSDATTVSFTPAPGMYIYGARVGLDCKVVSIDSSTSMTVSINNTNTITTRTLQFVVGTEGPEIACIPQSCKVIQNQLYQATTLGTGWTLSNITATNAAASGPCDIQYAGTIASTATKLLATAANGTATYTTQTGVGPHTFSVFARADLPNNSDYITFKLDLGSGTQTFTATNKWQRFALNFTTTTNNPNVVITLPAMGTVLYIQHAMVTVGSDTPPPITATTTVPVIAYPQHNWGTTMTAPGVGGWNIDGGSGLELNLNTAGAGPYFYTFIHLGTASNFAISDTNQIFSTETSASAEAIINCISGSNGILVKNYSPISLANPPLGHLVYNAGGAAAVTIKDSSFALNGSTWFLCYLNPGYNLYLHNIDLYNPRNYIAAYYLDAVTTNNTSKTLKLQNVRCNKSRIPWASQVLDNVFKGVGGDNTMRSQAATSWVLSSTPTQDSLPITNTALYDGNFAEMTYGTGTSTTGCLHLRMTASSKTSKPYILTGTAYFDNTGKLYLPNVGDTCTFEWPHYIKGVTGFRKMLHQISSVDLGLNAWTSIGALVEYDLDKGSGYSGVWRRVNSDPNTLAAETGFNTTIGFKIKIRITCRKGLKYTGNTNFFVLNETIWNAASNPTATAVVLENEYEGGTGTIIVDSVTGVWNTGNTIYSTAGVSRGTITATNGFVFFPQPTSYINGIKIFTSNDTTNNKYDYALATINVTNLVSGSRVKATKVSDGTVIYSGTETGGIVSFTTNYEGSISIEARKASSAPYYQPWITVITTVVGITTPVTALQVLDQ